MKVFKNKWRIGRAFQYGIAFQVVLTTTMMLEGLPVVGTGLTHDAFVAQMIGRILSGGALFAIIAAIHNLFAKAPRTQPPPQLSR